MMGRAVNAAVINKQHSFLQKKIIFEEQYILSIVFEISNLVSERLNIMEIIKNKNMNKIFEILGLLYINSHPEYMEKERLLESASEYAINSDELYKKFGSIHKKYVSVFQKKLIQSEKDSFFFEDVTIDFILILQTVIAKNPHWLDCINKIPDEEIFLSLINAIIEEQTLSEKPSLNKTIELLKQAKLPPNICWKMMLLLQDTKKQIEHLICIINLNTPAYEYAVSSIEKPLQRLLNDFPKTQCKIVSSINHDVTVTPTLIYPATEILDVSGYGYVGLFVNDVYKMIDKSKNSRNNLTPILKALSDGSKFDILVSLKNSPKYNMELAEQLGLTAATISHHMSVLLAHELVNIDKRDGRVYYTLAKNTIKDIIDGLQSTFSI